MAGPLLVIVAGAVTVWLAFSTADGLVEDDYYRSGLAVNQRLHRDAVAASNKLSAMVMLGSDKKQIRVTYSAETKSHPTTLILTLAHPTRSGYDQRIALLAQGGGVFAGLLATPVGGRRHVTLEDEARTWRLQAEWNPEQSPSLTLLPSGQRIE